MQAGIFVQIFNSLLVFLEILVILFKFCTCISSPENQNEMEKWVSNYDTTGSEDIIKVVHMFISKGYTMDVGRKTIYSDFLLTNQINLKQGYHTFWKY